MTNEEWCSKFPQLTKEENNIIDEARGSGMIGYSPDGCAAEILANAVAYLDKNTTKKYSYFIVSSYSMSGGYWGGGNTVQEALSMYKKVGGKKNSKVKVESQKFVSDYPFAPVGRNANEDECECYIDTYGAVCWLRCIRLPERELV